MSSPASTVKRGMLLVISGPAGVGKTTITRYVQEQTGAAYSVSVTTRPKTGADVEGVDYHFVTREQFERQKEQGQFLESAEVFGNLYGTPRGPVEHALATGQLVILEIDVQGAIQVKRNMPEAFGVFILPPSEDELLDRLRGRAREDEQTIQRRFAKATAEIKLARESGVYSHFVVNDDLDTAKQRVLELVRDAWHGHRDQCVR